MTAVHVTVDLPYRPEIVWQALADKRLLSLWLMPTDLAPIVDGVYRAFPPPGMIGFDAAFDIEVVDVVAGHRFVQRWLGDQMHTTMTWEITSIAGGSRLSVVQSGFFGLDGERRRETLAGVYRLLFEERLGRTLATMVDEPVPEPNPSSDIDTPDPRRPSPWRVRLLSIGGAMVLTVLIATALATMALRRPEPPLGLPTASTLHRPPGVGQQPGVAPTPMPVMSTTSPGASPSAPPAIPTLSVTYRVDESFEGGFIGSITLTAGATPIDGWTATIELPAGGQIYSAWDRVTVRSTGRQWIFTPEEVHRKLGAGEEFTFFFQAGSPAGPAACSVNGVPCSGLSSSA